MLPVELIRDDLREDAQEADVALVQRGFRGTAETAERPVQASVPEPDGNADVRADARLAGHGEIGGPLVVGGIADEMRQVAPDHLMAVGVFLRDPRTGLDAEPFVLPVDGLHDKVLVERTDERDVHVERRTREGEDPLDRLARTVKREPRELGQPLETGGRLRRDDSTHGPTLASVPLSTRSSAMGRALRASTIVSMSLSAGMSLVRKRT